MHLGQLRGELVVRDTAQQLPVEQEQVDQESPFGHRRSCSCPLPGSCRRSPRRQAVDLGLQVRQGDDPARGARPVVFVGQAGDDGASSAGADAAAEHGPQVRRVGVGGIQVGEAATRRLGRPVDAVADPRSVQAADQQRVENVHDVVVG